MSNRQEQNLRTQPVRQALVSGASGFLGRALCARLQDIGVEVTALSRRPVNGPWNHVHALDLSCDAIPHSVFQGIDTVFHLAGKAHAMSTSREKTDEHHLVNTEGTSRIADAARQAGVANFIFVSSVKANFGHDAYAESKRRAEGLVLALSEGSDMHAVVVRPALIYGPGWKGNLHAMELAVRKGRFPPIPELGNRRSLIHVDDVIDALLVVAEHPAALGKTYVVTDGQPYSTRRIYIAMCSALGKKVPRWTFPVAVLKVGAQLGDMAETTLGIRLPVNSAALDRLTTSEEYDSSPIRKDLGWKSRRTLEEALPQIISSRYTGEATFSARET